MSPQSIRSKGIAKEVFENLLGQNEVKKEKRRKKIKKTTQESTTDSSKKEEIDGEYK